MSVPDWCSARVLRVSAIVWHAVLGVALISLGRVMRFDESVYSARAADVVDAGWGRLSVTGPYWSDERAPGYPYLQSLVFRWFGESDGVARLTVLASSVVLVWMLGRLLDEFFDRWVGTVAVIITVLCPGYVVTATSAMADIPAATFAAVALAALTFAWTRQRWWLLSLVPVGMWMATATRFGAVIFFSVPLGLVGVGALSEMVRRRRWRLLAAFVSVGMVTLVGVWVLLSTGLLTGRASPREAKADGIAERELTSTDWIDDLWSMFDPGRVDLGFHGKFWNAGYLVAFLAVTVAAVALCVRRRRFVLLATGVVSAVVPVVVYGWSAKVFVTSYLAPIFLNWSASVAVLSVGHRPTLRHRAGADPSTPIAFFGEHEPRPDRSFAPWTHGAVRRAVAVAVASAVALVAVDGALALRDSEIEGRRLEAMAMLAAQADGILGSDCTVFTLRRTQVSWYSQCRVIALSRPPRPFPADADRSARDEWWSGLVDASSERAGITGPMSMLVVGGYGNWVPIDDAMARSDPRRSVLITEDDGWTTALITVADPLPSGTG